VLSAGTYVFKLADSSSDRKQAPLKAQKPTEEEVDISEVFVAQASATDQPQLPAELPKTDSLLPLIGLVGLLSIGAALGLRFAATRKEF
jgi:hypothetical protein